MNALIAFRRLVTPSGGNPFYQVRIAVRSYACFNGFNTHGAFNPMGNEGDAMFIADTRGNTRLDNLSNWYESIGQMDRVQGQKGQWETLGIGWLYSGARKATDADPGSPIRLGGSDADKYDWKIGVALCSEGFLKQYYDGYTGETKRTKRVLTPNEEFLSKCFENNSNESPVGVASTAQKRSFFATALAWSRHYCYNLFQFVGSERPSGQAVSYLQTFRNISEAQYSGWKGLLSFKRTVLLQVIQRQNGNESLMPFFDVIHNHGTDNAIVAYAGPAVMAFMVRYGFWSAREFYRCSDSMLVEGRYNKGEQSISLKNNFDHRATSTFRVPRVNQLYNQLAPTGSAHLFDTLKQACTNSFPSMSEHINTDRILNAVQTDIGFREAVNRYETALRTIRNLDVVGKITRIFEVVRGDLMLDPRTPPPAPPAPEPVAPPQPAAPVARAAQPASESATPRNTTAGAAQGFVQWTAGATIH